MFLAIQNRKAPSTNIISELILRCFFEILIHYMPISYNVVNQTHIPGIIKIKLSILNI